MLKQPLKTSLKYVLILFSLMHWYVSLTAQSYIVTTNRDTLYGQIKIQEREISATKIMFKSDADQSYQTYEPSQLIGFRFNSIGYVSVVVSLDKSLRETAALQREAIPDTLTSKVFLEEVHTTSPKVYRYMHANGVLNYFVHDKGQYSKLNYSKTLNADMQLQESFNYRNQLIQYFQACPQLQSYIERMKYTDHAFEELFLRFDQCSSSKTPQPLPSKMKPKFYVIGGVGIGNYSFRGIDYAIFSGAEMNTLKQVMVGGGRIFFLDRKYQSHAILLEPHLTLNSANGTDDVANDIKYGTSFSVQMKHMSAAMNLLYRNYLITKPLWDFHVEGGLLLGYTLWNATVAETIGFGVTHPTSDINLLGKQGLVCGAGFGVRSTGFSIRWELAQSNTNRKLAGVARGAALQALFYLRF